MKYAVFITSGIGNTVLLIPFLNRLRESGSVTLICTAKNQEEQILLGYSELPFDRIKAYRSPLALVTFLPMILQKFDQTFIDSFGLGRRNFSLAHLVSKNVIVPKVPLDLSETIRRKLTVLPPATDCHEASNSLRQIDKNYTDSSLISEFSLRPKSGRFPFSKFISIQLGSGNNLTPWKSWPVANYIELIELIRQKYPEKQIVLFGDRHDLPSEGYFERFGDKVKSLINRTKLIDLPYILSLSILHIGNDSGLMHVAGSVGTKTISIFGGSDPKRFGWEVIDQTKHVDIQHKMSCQPCNRYFLPNRSRVSDPKQCPDFACIRKISVNEVFDHVQNSLKD